jgi:hypothetical protein
LKKTGCERTIASASPKDHRSTQTLLIVSVAATVGDQHVRAAICIHIGDGYRFTTESSQTVVSPGWKRPFAVV